MRVEFSKEFEKAVRKLSGKMLDSVRNVSLSGAQRSGIRQEDGKESEKKR